MLRGIVLITALVCLSAGLSTDVDKRRGTSAFYQKPRPVFIPEIPYTTQLRNSSGYIVCAGTLISSQHVATAAHCFDNYEPKDITVVAGASSNTDTGVQRAIEKLFKHETYNPTTMHNDAAVIKLDSPVEASDYIYILDKLCSKAPESEDLLRFNGWRNTVQTDVFSAAKSPILTQDACAAYCKETGIDTEITSSMFCGNINIRFSCEFTAGGPAYFQDELCGITVGGSECDNPKFPGVFTSVYAVRDFIEKSMTL